MRSTAVDEQVFTGQWYDYVWFVAVILHVILATLAIRDITWRARRASWSWSTLLVSLWVMLAPIAGPTSYLVLRRRAHSRSSGQANS